MTNEEIDRRLLEIRAIWVEEAKKRKEKNKKQQELNLLPNKPRR